jgi:hypothetical protein
MRSAEEADNQREDPVNAVMDVTTVTCLLDDF